MENEELTTFSLEDNPNDEIVEEEVIDRDEEYDDDDDYDEEEDYDDGYNDDYYDDRLDKVLDEIAELKRGMSAPSTTVQQQPPVYPPMPQYIYQQQPMGPVSAGSEVVMYNEISRLRDELAKNQSSLEMQKELSRIKDDMARDQKFAESQYNAEIKRLQDRIDDLLKNAGSSQGELPPAQSQAAQLESGKSTDNTDNNVQSLDFDKLLSINESILRAMREGDSRIQNEIAHLRSKVEAMPSAEELNRVASAVKKTTNGSEGINAEMLEKLSGEIASIRDAMGEGSDNLPSAPPVIIQGGVTSGDINASELLRQLYEIRNVLGSSSTAAVNRTQALLDLVADYRKVSFDVRSENTSLKDKLTSVYSYVKKLEECNEPDAVDLIEATNELIEGIAAQKLDKKSYADLSSYLATNGKPVPAHVRESADKFFGICEKIASLETMDTVADYLPDLLAERNTLENNRHEEEINKIVDDITAEMLEEKRDDDDIKEKLEKLTDIIVADVADLPLIDMPKSYKPAHTVSDETVFSKLAELKAAFDESLAAQKAAEEKAAEEKANAEKQEPKVEEVDPNAVTLQDVFDAVDDLRAALAQNTGSDENADISAMLEEVRNNYIDLSERIIEVSDLINAQNENKVEDEEEDVELITDDQKLKAIDDLEYIHGKLDEQEAFLSQISEIRSDILNISGSIDLTEQLTSVTADISAQFDKLYEDLSNVIIESEANIVGKITEPTVLIDAIEAAKLDVITETQAVKDTLALISDSIASTAVLDAIDGIRNDLSAFADITAANTDASSADRQKLLDDVAFLREQAEAALESSQSTVTDTVETTSETQESEKIYAYLDELANRVAALAAVPDDVAVTKDTVALVSDSVNALSENVTALNDAVHPIAEDVAAARDAAAATLDALAPITDQLNVILDKLSADVEEGEAQNASAVEGEESDPVLDDLAEVKDNLNTILDTLPLLPQNDDLITARDNTYSILDTLSMMPQNDDIVATRDNVAAVLDGVNALTESVKSIIESQQDNAALADDMAVVIDNTSAILDSVASLAQTQENVSSLRETLESGYAATALEGDIQYIRQKLDEPTDSESVADILQDIGIVLDKLEAFEQSSVTDKQDIIDAISGIREEVHINELDENIAASGIDDETRDVLVNEISEIRERLGNIENTTNSISDVNSTVLDNITVQLADIQNALASQVPAETAVAATEAVDSDTLNAIFAELSDIKDRLEDGVTVMGAEGGDATVSSVNDESLQAIADELAIIREKIDTESEYDTIEEILSLREDVKAARIVDQNDVSGELESIKNELAAISSENILDEIRALREEVASMSAGGEDATTPTNDELNLVLNEIVSLRDEMFAFKDEVLSATAVQDTAEPDAEADVADDDVTTILDELTALRADQTAITDNIDELKDIISRRTTISADATEQEAVTAASNELNVVLGEIIDIKNNIERVEESLPTDRLDGLTAQVEEIKSLIDEMRNGTAGAETSSVVTDNSVQAGIADDIAELRAEIDLLRSENEVLRRENADMVTNGLNELRDAIHDMALTVAPVASSDGDTSYAALIDEIRSLKAEVAESKAASQPVGLDEETIQSLKDALSVQAETVTPLAEELSEIRDEIAQLRSLTTVTAENSGAVEIAEIRDELEQLKSSLSSPESFGNIAEDVTSIKADVRAIKDEPDLGVLNEILALRDEFQKLREQIEDVKEIASKTDEESDGAILNEVQSLRDQLFAISMANVNDSASGESNYESYNNIILDEIASLREQATNAGSEEELKAVTAEIQDIKAALEKREDLYDALAKRVEKLDSDATNNKILEELESLRTELANQRDADLTTLNFMSEMAHLLERQNNYISQNTGTKISDEIESLKAEIASTDAVAEEIAKLREIMTRSGNASDNDTILNELAGLREELSAEKPSKENELILEEIARLRDELMTLKANEQVQDHTDSDLKDTLSDLKDQLNEIAEIVEPAEAAEKPATKKPAAKKAPAKRGRPTKSGSTTKSGTSAKKPAAKKSTAKRTANKAATPTSTVTEQPEEVIALDDQHQVEREEVDFDIKLGDEIAKMTSETDDMSLNPQGPISSDSMDVADKLAKQVANKLVMEQLVEQLGDGGVSDERVDEILRDILPQEFTTVALNEQSDKVRKLANRLVLNKLRDRLGGRVLDTDDDDDDNK